MTRYAQFAITVENNNEIVNHGENNMSEVKPVSDEKLAKTTVTWADIVRGQKPSPSRISSSKNDVNKVGLSHSLETIPKVN